MKSIIKKGIIVICLIITGEFLVAVNSVKAEENTYITGEICENRTLDVSIVRADGIMLTPKDNENIETNANIIFNYSNASDRDIFKHVIQENITDSFEDYFLTVDTCRIYRISNDGGNSFGDWKSLDNDSYIFDISKTGDGKFCIQFGKYEVMNLIPYAVNIVERNFNMNLKELESYTGTPDDIQRPSFSDKELVKYVKSAKKIVDSEKHMILASRVYSIVKDTVAPQLEVASTKELNSWQNEDIKCSIKINDTGSKLLRLRVFCDSEVILEKEYGVDESKSGCAEEVVLQTQTQDSNGHLLKAEAYDRAGNVSFYEQRFFIDKTKPELSIEGVENNKKYNGKVDISVVGSDNNPDKTIVTYVLKKAENSSQAVIDEGVKPLAEVNGEVLYSIKEDGDYSFECHGVDAAGNGSMVCKARFRIDTCAPTVSFCKIADGASANQGIDLGICVTDNFEDSYSVELSGSVKKNDGSSKLHLEGYKTEGLSSLNTYYFTEDGEYTVSVKACDDAGNVTEDEIVFSIDTVAPVISISKGIIIGESIVTNEPPVITYSIHEENYDTAEITCELRRKSDKDTMELMETPKWVMNSEKTDFTFSVEEEGTYSYAVTAMDAAGNMVSKTIEFTLDMSAPEIDYVDELNQKYVKSFSLPKDFKQYISDDSEVKYETYINSKNLSENEVVSDDGKYILKVYAIDDAGNESEKTVEFIVDGTMPQVVIDGMDEEGNVNKDEILTLALYDEEDYFTSVKINGVEQVKENNQKQVEINIPDYGEYTIEVTAVDNAENELTQTILAKCANASPVEMGAATVRTLKEANTSGSNKGLRVFLIVMTVVILAVAVAVFCIYMTKEQQKLQEANIR